MAGASGCLGGQWEGGHTHTHTHKHTHQRPAFGHRDASEQVGSNGMREGNARLTPCGGSSCARGGFAYPAPMGQSEPLTRFVNGVRFISVNPSPPQTSSRLRCRLRVFFCSCFLFWLAPLFGALWVRSAGALRVCAFPPRNKRPTPSRRRTRPASPACPRGGTPV